MICVIKFYKLLFFRIEKILSTKFYHNKMNWKEKKPNNRKHKEKQINYLNISYIKLCTKHVHIEHFFK